MGNILITAFLMLLNIAGMIWMYKEKNYKTAIFSGFAIGILFMNLLIAILSFF